MAMLAEGRRKQKISTNPRGNEWRKDENKFGQKLMEKMGWSEGKGLGAKEDGHVDHVGISLKADKRGVGCSKSHVDNWIAHQDDFSALLDQLNENHRGNTSKSDAPTANGETTTPAVLKMEEKSRKAKGRVHYQKFTKGKDLSLKSGTDLDCVFGKRKSQSGTNTPDIQASSDESDETTEPSHGVKTIRSSDSIQEYFARKMAEKRNRSNTDLEIQNTAKITDPLEPSQDALAEGEHKKKKKSKKDKRKAKEAEIIVENKQSDENEYLEERVSFTIGGQEELSDEIVNDVKTIDIELENVEDNAKDGIDEKTVKKKSKKSKKNKRRHEDAFGENCEGTVIDCLESDMSGNNNQDVADNVEALHESGNVSQKKKKSKKQKKRERESL